jgi:putative methionine-R-sulfoxide reductase with GAF domain
MPKFIIIEGPLKGQTIELGEGAFFFGRNPKINDIEILDITVSRKHFKISKIDENLFIEDLKSKHGTIVNGKLIKPGEGFRIKEGDLITIGKTVMLLTDVQEKGAKVKKRSIPEMTKTRSVSGKAPDREKRSKKELELIYKVSELFKKRMDVHEFFENVLKLLFDALPRIDNAKIFLFGSDKNPFMEVIAKSHKKPVDQYCRKVLDKVIQDCETVRISNMALESTDDFLDSDDGSLKIGSVLCVPIVSGDEILGAIYIDSLDPYGFREDDQLLLSSLAGPMAIEIEKDWLAKDHEPD